MTFALIFAFPPLGSAKMESQIKHFIIEEAFPNIICSFLHFEHLTFTNLPFIKMFKKEGL